MIVKLLTEHHLEFLSLIGGCRGSPESTLVKMSNCWKSHALAHIPYSSSVLNSIQMSLEGFQLSACFCKQSRKINSDRNLYFQT